jgi:regulation of enolase protein 1 (concanavalin A-like superfamily)
VTGSASYANNVFTVVGVGAQIYGTADAFHFVYQPLSGDGTIMARLVSLQGGSRYASVGVMIREALSAGSTNAKTADWPSYGGIYFDVRTTTGGGTSEPGNVSATLPYWVRVTRSGNTFTSYTSSDGANWVQLGASQTISMAQNAFMGLAVTSGSTTALTTATFDNVSITSP